MSASPGQRARLAPARALAGLLVPAGLATTSVVLGWAAAAPIAAVRAPGPAPVDALLALGAALACAGLLALAAVGAAVTLAVAVSGRLAGRWAALAEALTPHVVRAAVGLLVGATVVGGQSCLASRAGQPMALARTGTASAAAPKSPGRTPQLPSGWSPDRPVAGAPRPARPRDQAAPQVNPVTTEPAAGGASRLATVVVHHGDSLWALAARHLGAGATDAEVASEWPRWQARNRSTIGPDPDLIHPGERLRIPASRHPAHTVHTATDQTLLGREESP